MFHCPEAAMGEDSVPLEKLLMFVREWGEGVVTNGGTGSEVKLEGGASSPLGI